MSGDFQDACLQVRLEGRRRVGLEGRVACVLGVVHDERADGSECGMEAAVITCILWSVFSSRLIS